MGQRNEAEVGGDTRDINVCWVDECNGDFSPTTTRLTPKSLSVARDAQRNLRFPVPLTYDNTVHFGPTKSPHVKKRASVHRQSYFCTTFD